MEERGRSRSRFHTGENSLRRSLSRSPSWSSRLNTNYHCDGDNDGIDRISDMPDSVLHHILSFMDMEDVIRNTSLISKRWRDLWISLPILNFNRYKKTFTGFVDRVLLNRDDSVIKSLRISYQLYDFGVWWKDTNKWMMSDVDWIAYAAEENVEELCIHFDNHRNQWYDLTWPEFSNIQVFKLKAVLDLKMPRSLFMDTQLKTLKLEFVKLSDGRKVVPLSCSVLENLAISYCRHDYMLLLHISAPKLKNLEIKNGGPMDECKLQISSPNLTSLILRGTLYDGYSFENISSIVKATFECYYLVSDFDMISNIVEGLHNATSLELCGELIQKKSVRSLHMLDHQFLNTFVNLKCLKLIGWSRSSGMHPIHSLLMNSYALEALVLKSHHVREAHDWTELFPCIYRLKSIVIKEVIGCENEINFFEFILKNADVLDDFTIYKHRNFRRRNSREDRAEFSMKIHSLPRASSSVKILGISLN